MAGTPPVRHPRARNSEPSMRYMRLWLGLGAVIVGSFAVLGYFGRELYRQAPPIPDRVVTTDGRVIYTGEDIREGQNVWQSMGGQEVGTVWGHGSNVAPDWSADWLHRESEYILNYWADTTYHKAFKDLPADLQAMYKARLQQELRTNTYDASADKITVSAVRAQ